MKSALRDPNPVIFYEVKELYRKREIEQELDDEPIPLGKANVVREGDDLTIVTYGNPVHFCLEAAKQLESQGVNAEVIDLRTLVPLDEQAILESVEKTNRVIVVNEASRTCGFAGEVVARVNELAFTKLDAPVLRVTRADTPVPGVKPLELAVLPSIKDIVETAMKVAKF
jgi:pyruvate/2-oxoglutarate/acetoin dehydrogenase E1 component